MHLNFVVKCNQYTKKWKKKQNSAILWDIKLKIATGARLEDILDKFSAVFEKFKIFGKFLKHFRKKKIVILFNFSKFWKSDIVVL